MGFATAAIIGATVAGTATSVITGSKAAKAQKEAAQSAQQTQLQMFNKVVELNEPFRQQGLGALDLLSDIFVKGNTEKIQQLPGIKFLREQGEQAIGRAQSARGNFLSGAAVKEAIRFNQGLASTNISQVAGPLGAIAGVGQSAVNSLSNAALQTGANVGNAQIAAGNARAAGLANIGSSINSGLNNFLFASLMPQTTSGLTFTPGVFNSQGQFTGGFG